MRNYPKNQYRVITKDLKAYKNAGNNFEELKQYCKNDDVIVTLKPKAYGIRIRLFVMSDDKIVWFHKLTNTFNIFKLHFQFSMEYTDVTDKVVYPK